MFIYNAREMLATSRVGIEIKSLDNFISTDGKFIKIDVKQLTVAYRRKRVEASLKVYYQMLVKFLIPAMIHETEETILNFIIKGDTNIIAQVSFDVDFYRRKLVKEIESVSRFWEAKLKEHEITVKLDEKLVNNKFRVLNLLDLAVRNINKLHTPVPTVIRMIDDEDK